MSKSCNPGELRTPCYFMRKTERYEAGFLKSSEQSAFGTKRAVRVKWVNAHGSDIYTAQQDQLRQSATLTLRYSPLLDDPELIVYRAGDETPYEIISVDNVEQRNRWLEITVRRMVEG